MVTGRAAEAATLKHKCMVERCVLDLLVNVWLVGYLSMTELYAIDYYY